MSRPNILFLMTDQMQGRVLDPEHPCQTPNFDKLAKRGVRVRQAYTPNPVCSPARASLMTGLLPHSHGVVQVTHCMPKDVGLLRTQHPHWTQNFVAAGYRTAYFGKWHVENTESPSDFGWQVDGSSRRSMFQERFQAAQATLPEPTYQVHRTLSELEGYREVTLYAANDRPVEARMLGVTTDMALDFLDDAVDGEQPWVCCASVIEPHDPFICGQEAYQRYDVDALPVPENWDDDLAGRPGLYRKCARAFSSLTLREKKEAAACYYAMISEIDDQFGRLIDRVEAAGQLDNTIVILTSDHGEFLGAHGLYTKNVSAYEEAYHIPMLLAGPGIAEGAAPDARVGLHDVGPTLADLAGIDPFVTEESTSFSGLLRDPSTADQYRTGFAEYYGGRFWWTQRVFWDGPWKLVWNGFDFDELYNLDDDPGELANLIERPDCRDRLRAMMAEIWKIVKATDDHPLGNSQYMSLRLAPFGPDIVD